MTDRSQFPNRIEFAMMNEFTSQHSGRTYYSGFAGKLKIVMTQDLTAEPCKGSTAVWKLSIEQAPPRKAKE
jgi:hypothetical protein